MSNEHPEIHSNPQRGHCRPRRAKGKVSEVRILPLRTGISGRSGRERHLVPACRIVCFLRGALNFDSGSELSDSRIVALPLSEPRWRPNVIARLPVHRGHPMPSTIGGRGGTGRPTAHWASHCRAKMDRPLRRDNGQASTAPAECTDAVYGCLWGQ
jgi:hypothetical protein